MVPTSDTMSIMLASGGLMGRGKRFWRAQQQTQTSADGHELGARVITRRLAGTPDQVAHARAIVRETLGIDHGLLDDVLLMTSELTTNALRHSASGDEEGMLALSVTCTDGWVRVVVRDEGSTEFPRVLQAGTEAVGGRGIALVDRLSVRWGFTSEPDSTGVWFESGTKPPLL